VDGAPTAGALELLVREHAALRDRGGRLLPCLGGADQRREYARAETVGVELESTDGSLVVTVADDGIGGAGPERGSGLRGLVDRVDALGGRLDVDSPPGAGTRVRAQLPTNVLGSLDG
jgi:hypothetical protein